MQQNFRAIKNLNFQYAVPCYIYKNKTWFLPSDAVIELHGALGQYGKWSSPFNRFIKPNSFIFLCPVNIVDISLNVPFLYNKDLDYKLLNECWFSTCISQRYMLHKENMESKYVNDYYVVLTPRSRPILLMGRLVLGRNRWPRLINGSSYPKTNSCAVIGMKGFMCIPLKKIDNPIVMKRGRLLLCVESVCKEKKAFVYLYLQIFNECSSQYFINCIDWLTSKGKFGTITLMFPSSDISGTKFKIFLCW